MWYITTMSKPLTFAELEEGEKFIAFPTDGDDHGHGGYRKGAWIFTKLRLSEGKDKENSVRCVDGVLTKWSPNEEVYKVT